MSWLIVLTKMLSEELLNYSWEETAIHGLFLIPQRCSPQGSIVCCMKKLPYCSLAQCTALENTSSLVESAQNLWLCPVRCVTMGNLEMSELCHLQIGNNSFPPRILR